MARNVIIICFITASLAACKTTGGSLPLADAEKDIFADSDQVGFKLEDRDGRMPSVHLLNGSSLQKTVASAIHLRNGTTAPDGGGVLFNLAGIIFSEEPGDELSVALIGTTLKYGAKESISKKDFFSGKTLELDFPEEKKSIIGLQGTVKAHLSFKYDARKQELLVLEGSGIATIIPFFGKQDVSQGSVKNIVGKIDNNMDTSHLIEVK